MATTTHLDRSQLADRIISTHRAADMQRRRREVALTATWLRELRGITGSGAVAGGRFKRSS